MQLKHALVAAVIGQCFWRFAEKYCSNDKDKEDAETRSCF
jgi:hypothetical protein